MNREILINHTNFETRVAILEQNQLVELFHERSRKKSVVGNIYKGRVMKVLPGMDAAFVDIGLEKSAFLHVNELRPDESKLEKEDPWTEHWPERPAQASAADSAHGSSGNGSSNGESSGGTASALPIDQLLREHQEIMVQVSKGPIGEKGARITAHPSLARRTLVYMPTMHNVGVSRQITSDEERKRLRSLVDRLRPEEGGFIIRTVGENRPEEEFRSDINYLITQWESIRTLYEKSPVTACVYEELPLAFRVLRDGLADDVHKLIVDDETQYKKIREFLREFIPRYRGLPERYSQREPLFDLYEIEEAIDRATAHKVGLPSGGSLVIDHAEALTAIDVNTGRYVGHDNHGETILKTNLEAVPEIVHQLRLRDIGGIIIIDFIDMESLQDRQHVHQALKEELRHDKARSNILQISEMGLVEMTRKREREHLVQQISEDCPYCLGSGRIKSVSTVSYELFRQLERIQPQQPIGPLTIHVHPDVADHIFHEERESLELLEKRFKQRFTWRTSAGQHHEQFEVFEF